MGVKQTFIGFGLLVFLLALGCSSKSTSRSHSLTIAGSTSVQPFAEKLAEIYMDMNPKLVINVQGGGSTAGIKAARQRAAQIGTSSRDLHAEENDLTKVVIAWDGIAIIVHPENPIQNLTLTEIQGIFSGKIRSWSQLGGRNKPIYFVTREEDPGQGTPLKTWL